MIRSRRCAAALWTVLVFLAAAAAIPVSAQETLDRTKVPAPGPPPVLRVPSWTGTPLGNGAHLIVAEKSDLPLVEITARAGFKNQSHFTTLFRRFTGTTPKAWRQSRLS